MNMSLLNNGLIEQGIMICIMSGFMSIHYDMTLHYIMTLHYANTLCHFFNIMLLGDLGGGVLSFVNVVGV